MVGICARLGMALALVCSSGCSRTLSEDDAHQKAIRFALGELSIGNPASQRIGTVETPSSYLVTYAPTEEKSFGGPVTVAVDKKTGEPRLVGPVNRPL